MILNWYRTAVVFVGTVIFFTNFADYSAKFGLLAIYWVALFVALTAPLMIPALFARQVHLPLLVLWCGVFEMITIIWYVPSLQNRDNYQDVRTRTLSVIFIGLMLFLMSRPKEQRTAMIAVAVSTVIASGLNIYELFHPLTFSTIPGRSSGFYTNVNQSGAALVLGLIIGYQIVPSVLRMPFVLLTAIGIVTTFSRAAIVGWVLVVLYLTFRAGVNAAQFRRLLALCVVVCGFFASPYWGKLQRSLENRGVLTLDVLQRLNFLSHGSTADASTTEREGVAKIGWRVFAERPFFGWGTGEHRQIEGALVGLHNVYLAMMVDHGIIGMFFLPTLIVCTLWGFRKEQVDIVLPFAGFLTLWGFFSHNVFEERYILLAVALTASIVASARMAAREAEPEIANLPKLSTAGISAWATNHA